MERLEVSWGPGLIHIESTVSLGHEVWSNLDGQSSIVMHKKVGEGTLLSWLILVKDVNKWEKGIYLFGYSHSHTDKVKQKE